MRRFYVHDGSQFVGPFPTYTRAALWCDGQFGPGNWTEAQVVTPGRARDMGRTDENTVESKGGEQMRESEKDVQMHVRRAYVVVCASCDAPALLAGDRSYPTANIARFAARELGYRKVTGRDWLCPECQEKDLRKEQEEVK